MYATEVGNGLSTNYIFG